MKVTFRVRENNDPQLTAWIKSLEKGKRSKEIREALKQATIKEGVN